jgi:hypothetical protein
MMIFRYFAPSSLPVALVLVFLGLSRVEAITLDWNNVNWTANSLSQSFDIDPSNAGNDITITISGNTGDIDDSQGASPDDNTIITGGQGGTQESLYLAANYGGTGRELVVTITFSAGYVYGVENVQFTIFDVDRDSGLWRDQIDQIDGTRNGVTASFADLTGTNFHDIFDSGTATARARGDGASENADPATDDANLNVVFNDAPVDEVSFRWTNQDSALDFQYIGLYDITYTPAVPEPATVVGGMLLGLFLAGYHFRQRISGAKPRA